jgi:hypothetical protein
MSQQAIRNRIKGHRRVRAGDLVPHEWNFRTHPEMQRAALEALYAQVGFARSLLTYELPDGRRKLIAGSSATTQRSAALTAAGKGEDAARLPVRVVLTLRRQARRWLRADLEVLTGLAGRDDPRLKQAVQKRLEHWQKDADLITVRDEVALANLPDHERAAWRQLWADVENLRKKVGGRP